jgi:tetratricopeptide (TPR) repeat protein
MKIALVLLALALPLASQDAPPSAEKAQRLFDRGKWSQAAEAYEAIAKADPENGEAWYRLGYSRHSLGEYGEAAAANERAVAFPAYRATSYYNLACARSLLGELDEAGSALDGAIEAGFLDFDLIQMDADLEALRKVRELPLPKARVFDSNRGRNGVVIPYLVQLPADYDPEREYPALASFAPGGGGPLATAWALDELWGDAVSEGDFIVLHLVAPDRGWFTHPSHHALEDLLKKVKREYDIEGDRFHFFGFGGGARSATTYSQMSKSYCRSLTLVSSTGWSGWDDGDLSDFKRIPVRQIVGAEDVAALYQARHVQEVFEKIGANASLTVLPDEDTLVPSLRKAELLAVIVAGLR